MELINLTPHSIIIYDGDEKVKVVPPDRELGPLRIDVDYHPINKKDGVNIVRSEIMSDPDMPPEIPDTYYIVSSLVQSLYPDRGDFLAPANLVRDAIGYVIGCQGLKIS